MRDFGQVSLFSWDLAAPRSYGSIGRFINREGINLRGHDGRRLDAPVIHLAASLAGITGLRAMRRPAASPVTREVWRSIRPGLHASW